jgi:hypothetical protein
VHDALAFLIAVVGIATLVRPTPVARAPRILRGVARRSGLEFVFDERGRLAAGADAERLVIGMFWRTARANGAFLTGVGLSELVLYNGPPLSRSTAESLAVAGTLCAGIIGPYLLLRPFHAAFGARHGAALRAVSLEDYLAPPFRVLGWFAALCALTIPVGALALAASDLYDGAKIFWEGLVGVPLASAAVLISVELRARQVRDSTSDTSSLYLWDVLRVRSLRLITCVGLAGTGVAWQSAVGGLGGVALEGFTRPEWVPAAQGVGTCLSLVFIGGAGLLAFSPSRRFRQRLWPALAENDRVIWGAHPAG